ncbi:response regulator [Geobacter pickeringii]|uniref:Chemotaxis protein CheY n=1 Tax=Geobacter pickeringii TaxID=345632 RepID=A0A0B5BDA9_9BACT|nr:response regulator [Geobacter pickeringii]AJE04452.1 chemotaxis protein CheY [Geobacter pickeringii]
MGEPTVLLVDDEQFFLNLLCEFLRESPVSVMTAESGPAALERVRTHRPALIVLDYRMPEMSGAACCARLKADPRLHRIPVIMVVGEGKDDDRLACRTAGCDAIITKPLDRREFLDVGRRFLPDVERRQLRVSYGGLAVFRKGDESFHGTVEDLSPNGAYVAARCNMEVDETLHLGFVLPGPVLVETESRVAWINQGHQRIKKGLPDGFGVEFLDLAKETSELVKRFVAENVPR